jgi:hypothetical protein
MIRTAYAVAVSAIAAACSVAFPSLSPQVGATASVIGAKSDRADVRPLGTDCGEQAWPYFDAACTRDPRIPLAQPRDVRITSPPIAALINCTTGAGGSRHRTRRRASRPPLRIGEPRA